MIKVEIRRDDQQGPWLGLGLTAGYWEAGVSAEGGLRISIFSEGENGKGVGIITIEGEDLDKVLQLLLSHKSLPDLLMAEVTDE